MKLSTRTVLLGFAWLALVNLLLQGCAKPGNELMDEAVSPSSPGDPSVHAIIKVPAGQLAPAGLPGKAADWRKAGIVRKALWVNSTLEEKETAGFAALLTLEFPDEQSYESWFKVEGSKLPSPVTVHRAEVLAQEQLTAYDSAISVFKVSYYTPKLPREFSAEWVDGYLERYLHAQLQAGILVAYTMYLQEDAAENGKMVLVLQYHDATIAREAEPIKAKLNEELVTLDANYAALAQAKERVRATQSVTRAEYQPLPAR